MEAKQEFLTDFLRKKQQLLVPIYQRTYSWTEKQCRILLKDIKNIANNSDVTYHFFGSIVKISKENDTSKIPQYTIIDGQQRITTILLIIAALIQNMKDPKRAKRYKEEYFINNHASNDLRYKLLLTEQDNLSLIEIIDEHPNPTLESNNIRQNFEFFKKELDSSDIEDIFSGLSKLLIVDIGLYFEKDDPQPIFESLNSKGLELSAADLIRNYVLMGLKPQEQDRIYNYYWRQMEKDFGQEKYKTLFDYFIRDFLTCENATIPGLKELYETFKCYFTQNARSKDVEGIMAKIYNYSQYYLRINCDQEKNIKLKEAFANMTQLNTGVVTPFLMNVYNDFENKIINEEVFLEILLLIQIYVFRRSICGYLKNGYNKFFAGLHKVIDKKDYLESLKTHLVFLKGHYYFPDDISFAKALKETNFYNQTYRNICFNKLENYNRKEYVNTDEYTVEHIMPQKLTDAWVEDLGENSKEIHNKYLHTLGNLTLTGYNSELSNIRFSEKKTIEGGFDNSPLRLNKSLKQLNEWNETTIQKRADELIPKILKIWPYPKVSAEFLEIYQSNKLNKSIYTIEDHPDINQGPFKHLFEEARKNILSLDNSITEKFLKYYVDYKINNKSFVSIIPKKSFLIFSLSINYEDISDPNNLCKNVINTHHWGNGNIEIRLSSIDNWDYVFNLIKKSFVKNQKIN